MRQLGTAIVLTIAVTLKLGAAVANGTVTDAIITELATQSSLGNVVMLHVDRAPTGAPVCSNNLSVSFVLPLTTAPNQQAPALLVTARATGMPVKLTGSGQCDVIPNVETLVSVSL